VPAPDSACRNTGCNRVSGGLCHAIRAGRRPWPRFTAHLRTVGVGVGARCVGDPQFRGWGRKSRVSAGWSRLRGKWNWTPRQVDWCPLKRGKITVRQQRLVNPIFASELRPSDQAGERKKTHTYREYLDG